MPCVINPVVSLCSRPKLLPPSFYLLDCSNEQTIKYGDNYHIPLSGVTPPITLEYRPIAVEANQTARPALVLLTSTGISREGYQGRISVNERHVTLSTVTGADEGSYTVRDAEGVIQRKVCLNVREHANFVTLPYGKRLKINLILNSSLVRLYYTPDNDPKPRLLLDKGEFTSAEDMLDLQERLSMEGSLVFLDQVKGSDAGVFKITDILGFSVSTIHLEVQPYKLESLYVAIIALLGLLVFLLLVCLLSCLIKVKKRAKRAAALEKIAQNAGKEDEGEAFRQVVKNITKLSEESKHSQADNTEKSQSTEVDIKGLEVSSKEVGIGNLETSDSGVGFNTALPLDTDTDAPDQIPDSEAVSISVAPETKPSPPSAAESMPSAPPAMEIKPSPVAETKASPTPETKKTPDQPVEVKLDVTKPEVKLSPAPSPEPKAGLSPADPKPESSPSPEPKAAAPKAPTPESKSALTPTPEPPKPTTPEPITNGTPEPGPDSKPSPDHADIIGGPKAAPPKTPEVELKSGGAVLEANKDGTVAEESTTT
uniref:Si:dkeyp-77h1.4 n=1 Tax=Lates calcarifer TaxID=8187 RepID=A0A4W6CD22_LATCA